MVSSQRSIEQYLAECRELTLTEIRRFVPPDRHDTANLYELMLDYPMRPAKALRPALCVATNLALGGHLDAALPSAAAFELFHNAFLVHDDVEDGSELRRHAATLSSLHGIPIAVNVGDGMLALALEPLLDNVRALGLGRALRILKLFARIARESVEGQMLELDWTRRRRWDVTDREYLRMVHKKTGWYSFIGPVLVGLIASGTDKPYGLALGRFALRLGISFQIQDDLLSLDGDASEVGKEAYGDLWEGKYTLPLLHALRSLPRVQMDEALKILGRPRPPGARYATDQFEKRLYDKIVRGCSDLTSDELGRLRAVLLDETGQFKTLEDVQQLARWVTARDGASLKHARAIASSYAARAKRTLERELRDLPDTVHKEFLHALVAFVVDRSR